MSYDSMIEQMRNPFLRFTPRTNNRTPKLKGEELAKAKGFKPLLTEWGEWDGETYPILGMKAVKVDGNEIKADTWYKLEDGKIVEAE